MKISESDWLSFWKAMPKNAYFEDDETLPLPPNNLPALAPIAGTGISGASVSGYLVKKAKTRQTHKLFAVVSGNPILLEHHAKKLGYSHATAVGPSLLDLGEIENQQDDLDETSAPTA